MLAVTDAYRHKNFVLSDQSAITFRIHVSGIRDIVPVRLEEMDDWIFKGEEFPEIIEGSVVTNFISSPDWVSNVETVPTEVVVRLPGSIGRLLQDVRMAEPSRTIKTMAPTSPVSGRTSLAK